MTKKPLFEVDNSEVTAMRMLSAKAENVEIAEAEDNKEQTPIAEAKVKKPTNRGRKRIYEEGEMVKLTVLVDKELSHKLKTLAKLLQGLKVREVMLPLIEEWVKTDHSLDYQYEENKNRKYTGFDVTPEFRDKFSEVCSERRRTQSFVVESLYKQAIQDLK